MKNVMNKKKATIIGLMAIVSTAFTNPVLADTTIDPPGMQVKYLGFRESNPVFEIILNNPQSDDYLITIKDKTGTVLFSEKISGKNISRKYRIDTQEEIEEGGLRFEVRSANSKKTEAYTVGITQTVKKDMAVNKVE